MPNKRSYRETLQKTLLIQDLDGDGCLNPVFKCRKCNFQWEPKWDEEGEYLLESYYCKKGCNGEYAITPPLNIESGAGNTVATRGTAAGTGGGCRVPHLHAWKEGCNK